MNGSKNRCKRWPSELSNMKYLLFSHVFLELFNFWNTKEASGSTDELHVNHIENFVVGQAERQVDTDGKIRETKDKWSNVTLQRGNERVEIYSVEIWDNRYMRWSQDIILRTWENITVIGHERLRGRCARLSRTKLVQLRLGSSCRFKRLLMPRTRSGVDSLKSLEIAPRWV